MAATAEEMQKHVRAYLMVFGALTLLTIITVAASWVHFSSVALTVAIAMLIAGIKGTLVACYFMHLMTERKALYSVLLLCVIFFVALMFLPVVTTAETDGLINAVS